ncbi:MAG: endopeptidase La [Bacilli bacterium]|nr:endopeptidase La [Bacilli bacterium]
MNKLPVLLLKSFVIFPNQEIKLELNNEISKKIINLSKKNFNGQVLVICPLDEIEESPDVEDLPNIGVVAKITQDLILSNNNLRVTLKGIKRVAVNYYCNNSELKCVLESHVENVTLPKFAKEEEIALRRKILELLTSYIAKSPSLSNNIINHLNNTTNFYNFTDSVISYLSLSTSSKLAYMQEINPLYRAQSLIKDLSVEIEILKLEEKIEDNLQLELEASQKEFILKEKIKQIRKELNEEDFKDEEVNFFIKKAESLNLNEKTLEKILKEIKKYSLISEVSPENAMIRNYIDTLLNLPWNKFSDDEEDLKKIAKVLNKSHYGLDEVKDRIIEYIATKKRNPNIKSPIICLIGPPGVGKSSLAASIAKALNKAFYKISVGGLNDPTELLGNRRTYIGASPGKIIFALQKCGVSNPVILIDEVDKMVKDIKGDPASALLDILDPNSNYNFVDNYIEEPFDLSKALFILTANNEDDIPGPLKDRLEIIKLSGYSEFEKLDIATNYIIPQLFDENLIKNEIKFSADALKVIINNYTKEAGVRDLTRKLAKIIRKVITQNYLNFNDNLDVTIKKSTLQNFLGVKEYANSICSIKKTFGLVNGLAYTSFGGAVMQIESLILEGSGKTKATGSLGKIMEESIEVALSYIKSNAKKYNIDLANLNKNDIHIHFLASAVKKEGPSAGCAITTSLISALLNKKVDLNIAMTGEITLNGEILKIGGLKEKLIGAYNNNIKVVFIPFENMADLELIDDKIKAKMKIIPVKNYKEIYDYLFERKSN